MRAISQARGAPRCTRRAAPGHCRTRVSGKARLTRFPISELKAGDVVLVRPGTRVPADGTVVEGAADVDESMITGESRTVAKGAGGKVHCRDGRQRWESSSPHYSSRRAGQPFPASCASLRLRQASGSRTQALADRGRRNPVLRGGRVWRNHFRLLVAFRRQRTCP